MPLWLAKLLSQNQQKRFDTKSSQFNINDQFEYIESQSWFNDRPVPTCITILDKFTHHYSYETMYYIRIEQIGCYGGSLVKYNTISEKDLRELLNKRKV